jgi:hypothetical protein
MGRRISSQLAPTQNTPTPDQFILSNVPGAILGGGQLVKSKSEPGAPPQRWPPMRYFCFQVIR